MKRSALVFSFLLMLLSPPLLIGAGGKTSSDGREEFQIAWVYGYGTPVEFTLRASRGKITMATGVFLILEARYPVGWEVSFPEIRGNYGGLMVRETDETAPWLDESGSMVASRSYWLEPLSPGLYLLPPVELMVSESGGEFVSTLSSDLVPIVVTSLLPEGPAEPRLQDMTTLPDTLNWLRFVLIGSGALAVMAAGLVLLMKKPSHRDDVHTQPFWKRAQAELDSLLAERLVERGEHRLFFNRLYAFLKSYMYSRFSVPGSEKTTVEYVQTFSDHHELRQYQARLASLLYRCDMGRFAQHPPPPEEVSESVYQLQAFLKDTSTDNPDADGRESQ
jgi:hypothetical protein